MTIKFEPLQKSPSGATAPSSEASLGMFGTENSVDRSKKDFYVISVKAIGGKVVAVVCWCKMLDEEFMNRYILNFAASLRERK